MVPVGMLELRMGKSYKLRSLGAKETQTLAIYPGLNQ